MRSSGLAAFAVLACVLSVGTRARADEKEACVAASDQGQTLRDEGKYRLAREQFQTCAREACPGLVRRDCERWLNDLETTYPTVVFGVRDTSGNDVTTARVSIDGQVAVDKLDGRPIKVDPGEHLFRYEAPGAAPVEQRAVIRVGEKNRQLTAIMMVSKTPPAPPVPVAAPHSRPAESTTDAPPSSEPSRPGPPVAGYVLAGVGVVALASFAYFGVTGRSDVDNLRSTCAPNCNPNDVDSAHAKLVVADVSLGVGVLAAAGAAYFLFFAPRSSSGDTSTASHVTFAPTRGGGSVGVVGTF